MLPLMSTPASKTVEVPSLPVAEQLRLLKEARVEGWAGVARIALSADSPTAFPVDFPANLPWRTTAVEVVAQEEDSNGEAYGALAVLVASAPHVRFLNARATPLLAWFFQHHRKAFHGLTHASIVCGGNAAATHALGTALLHAPALKSFLFRSEDPTAVPHAALQTALREGRLTTLAVNAPMSFRRDFPAYANLAAFSPKSACTRVGLTFQPASEKEWREIHQGDLLGPRSKVRAPYLESFYVNGRRVHSAPPVPRVLGVGVREPRVPRLRMNSDRKHAEECRDRDGKPYPLQLLYKHDYEDVLKNPAAMLNDTVVDWHTEDVLCHATRTNFLACSVGDFSRPDVSRPNHIVSLHDYRIAQADREGKRFVVAPACVSSHFVLLVFDLEFRKIETYDSRRASVTSRPSAAEMEACNALSKSVRLQFDAARPQPRATPRQAIGDAVNCGVFVCALIRRFSNGKPMASALDEKEYRAEMCDMFLRDMRGARTGVLADRLVALGRDETFLEEREAESGAVTSAAPVFGSPEF